MSIEVLYTMRNDDVGTAFQDLDDVRLLIPAATDAGDVVPAGTEGTIVYVAPSGLTLMVEFAEPEGALAVVHADGLVRIRRSSP